MILQPGFSTKEEVSEYSGRGVGMDVVKSVLESAGGNIFIESEQGRGSTFTLSVPLTLATMECIRFRVSDYRFPCLHAMCISFWSMEIIKKIYRRFRAVPTFCLRTEWYP